jgi:uncharacterized protein (TIGR03067 family)
MKLISLSLVFLLSVLASASLKGIQGTWKPTAGSISGDPLPKTMLDKIVLIIKGDAYDYDEGPGHDIGMLKEIPGKPLGLDIVGTKGPNKGRTFHAIYKLEGSLLTIYYALKGDRPKSFSEKGTTTLLMTYRRA